MSRSLERDLVDRARRGDTGASAALWAARRRWVAAILLAHAPRDAEIEDLLQEVAMRFVSRIGELQDPASFPAWLRKIALNAARTSGRRAEVRDRVLGPSISAGAAEPEGGWRRQRDDAKAREDLDHVLDRVSSLPPIYREPLLLRAVDGLSQREIASTLDIAETTVETRLARARRMLRELLAEDAVPSRTARPTGT